VTTLENGLYVSVMIRSVSKKMIVFVSTVAWLPDRTAIGACESIWVRTSTAAYFDVDSFTCLSAISVPWRIRCRTRPPCQRIDFRPRLPAWRVAIGASAPVSARCGESIASAAVDAKRTKHMPGSASRTPFSPGCHAPKIFGHGQTQSFGRSLERTIFSLRHAYSMIGLVFGVKSFAPGIAR